jgi:oligoendopeptidase F
MNAAAQYARALTFGISVSFVFMSSSSFPATTPERSTIDEGSKWDLSQMYARPEQWEDDNKKIEAMVADFESRKGTTGESPQKLLETLRLRDRINIQLEKLSAYASMRRDEDMG